MAKEDFCFTYYDGDAARDTTHMNRLERGAYHDLVISQRKFGHLNLDQVKKILGKDFNECWPAIELIMKVDTDGRFFIEWLETSVTKAKRHSKKQSQNVTKRYQKSTNDLPKNNLVVPLGDGNGDGNGIEENNNKKESEVFEYTLTGNETLDEVTFWTDQVLAGNDVLFLNMVRGRSINLNGELKKLAEDHLALCSRYGWHTKLTTQQAFRQSLLKHVTEKVNDKVKTTQKDLINERKAKFEQQ